MTMDPNDPQTAAEQHARRYYRQDHFVNQTQAERAYFRALAESLQRGREIARLAAKLGRVREKTSSLSRRNTALLMEIAQLKHHSPDKPAVLPHQETAPLTAIKDMEVLTGQRDQFREQARTSARELDELYELLCVGNLADALQSIRGLRERVKFTETFESLQYQLDAKSPRDASTIDRASLLRLSYAISELANGNEGVIDPEHDPATCDVCNAIADRLIDFFTPDPDHFALASPLAERSETPDQH